MVFYYRSSENTKGGLTEYQKDRLGKNSEKEGCIDRIKKMKTNVTWMPLLISSNSCSFITVKAGH